MMMISMLVIFSPISLDVALLLSRHYRHRRRDGETNPQGVSLCFLSRRPPMSNCIHNDQGVAVSITTQSLHKPASEKTEVKSMNIASQSLCSSLCEPLCDLQLHTHTQARLTRAQLLDEIKTYSFTVRDQHLL